MTFVIVYSLFVSYKVTLVYLGAIPVIAFVSTSLSKRIKKVQRSILAETTALAGSTTESLRNIELVKSLGLVKQEVTRLNNTTYKILGLELKKSKICTEPEFCTGYHCKLCTQCNGGGIIIAHPRPYYYSRPISQLAVLFFLFIQSFTGVG